MKFTFYLIFILVFTQYNLISQTVIEKGGDITINEIWNSDTVKITSTITVLNGVTLTIQPGATIVFQGHYSINVLGRILAQGHASDCINFTAKDTVLGDESGGWQGIRFDNTSVTNDSSFIEYCNFYFGNAFGSNWFDLQGGALAIKDFGKVVVKNNTFLKNKARGTNGIIYIRNSNPLILGNLIADNTGTAIEISNNANPLLLNNTIANNTGYGINRASYTPVIKNCIVALNKSGNLKDYTNQGNYISNCNIQKSGFTSNGNIDIDPQFIDAEQQNYALKNISPCIDAGSKSSLNLDFTFDLLGNTRIYKGAIDTIIDMGAYEFNEEPILLFTVNPDTLNFGDLLVGDSKSLSFKITNDDPFPITIYSISSTDADVYVPLISNKILQTGEFIDIDVNFAPETVKSYNTFIKIECNYRKGGSDSVLVLGKGEPAPIFDIENKKIEETLDCTDSVKTNIVLKNTGNGPLEYTIPTDFYDDFEDGLANWNYTGNWGVTTITMHGGFALTESPGGNYTGNMNTAITLKSKIQVFDASRCKLVYQLKTEMENCCDHFITEIQINTNPWIEIANTNGVQNWTLKVFDLSGYINSGDSLGVRFRFVSDYSNNFDGIMLDDLQITGVGTEKLKFSNTSGTILTGQSENIEITFNANNENNDAYSGQFKVLTNDPLKRVDTITYDYNVNRFSTLSLSNNTLLFGNAAVLVPDTLSCELINSGCDTMVISYIASNNGVFTPIFTSPINVAPNDSTPLEIVFNPIDSLVYNGKIAIVKADAPNDTTFLNVSGKGKPYAVLSLSTSAIDTSLMCDEEVQKIISIKNTGSDTLSYFIPTNFYDDFENDSNQWILTGTWGIGSDSYRGNGALSDSPSSNYGNNTSTTATLKEAFYVFDTSNCIFSYYMKHDIEACCDYVETQIQINGTSWQTIDNETGIKEWNLKSFDLSAFVNEGDSVKVRFKLTADGSVNRDGVSIDEVKITGSGIENIVLNVHNGEILPGLSEELTVTFKAAEVKENNIKAKFRIFSNEPYKKIDTVYCNYLINRYSTLTLLSDSLKFENKNILQADTLRCEFWNSGCDTLVIDGILSDNDAFKIVASDYYKLAPQDTGAISIVFSANDSLAYVGEIAIVNSGIDADTTFIKVSGNGNPYAVLELDKNLIDTTLFCSDVAETIITLRNSGTDTLKYHIPQDFYDGFESGLGNWIYTDAWGIDSTTVLGSMVLSESPTGNYANGLNSSISLLKPIAILDAKTCRFSFDLKADIEACCDSLLTEIQINNNTWIKLDRFSGDTDWMNKEFDLSDYLISGDSLKVRFRFISDYAESFNGSLIDNVKITGIGIGQLNLSQVSGEVSPGDEQEIKVLFDAAYLQREKYQAQFQLFSNNPLKNRDTVWCNYTINKMSSMNLLTDSLAFGSKNVLEKDSLSCLFFNKGCDTLKISDVFLTDTAFSIDLKHSKFVAPDDTCIIKVYFTPHDSINFTGNLGIVHTGMGADTTLIKLSGKGKAYPKFNLSLKNIDTTQVCGTETKFNITLINRGGSALTYYIPVNFYDDFENGLGSWVYDTNWGIAEDSTKGTKVLSDSPEGDYLSNTNSTIYLKDAIAIMDASDCKLSYDLYREMEWCCDYLLTEIQVNNKAWHKLDEANNQVNWTLKTFDLSELVSKNDTIRIRFRFTSDLLNNLAGASIDNVSITGACSNQLHISKSRGEIEAGKTETLVLTNSIPFNTSASQKGSFVIHTNDPYKNTDSLTYNFRTHCEGLNLFFGGGRAGAVSFVIDSVPYIALGENGTHALTDLWKFEKASNKWEVLPSFPGNARSNAVAFVLDRKAYVGLGYNSFTKTNYNDFYCFNPADSTWTQIADFGGEARSAAVSFAINGLGYVGTGIKHNLASADTQFIDFWVYKPKLNRWDSISQPLAKSRSGANGFEIYGRGYLSGGFNTEHGQLYDLFEYNAETNEWIEQIVSDSTSIATKNATVFTEGNKAFLSYGSSPKIASFHPQSGTVKNYGDTLHLQSTRLNPISFVINDTAYFGLGKSFGTKTDSLVPYYSYHILKVPLVIGHSPTEFYLSNTIVDEKNEGSLQIGTLETVDKTKGDSFTYEVVENEQHFYIVDNQLMSDSLDYEEQKTAWVKLKTIDNEKNYFIKEFQIHINDVNEAPYNLKLSGDSVIPGSDIGTLVGLFSASDQDTLNTISFHFNSDNGILESTYYTIRGDSLLVNSTISAADMVHRFYVEAVDNTGLSKVSEFLIAVVQGVGIQLVEQDDNRFLVYPNPANDYINIKCLTSDIAVNELIMVNATGHIVKKQRENGTGNYLLNIGALEPGIYLLIINTKEGSYLKKVAVGSSQ